MEKGLISTSPFRTRGGVHVEYCKNTENCQSERVNPPKTVAIPMSQHAGVPCEPIVKAGDTVTVGQKIGESDKFISAPIHASVSGKVTKIDEFLMPNGFKTKSVIIESDGEMTPCPDIKPPVVTDAKSLIAAARESGLVGLGGAGFPAHVKLNVPEGKTIDTLVINGAECEPYITSDYREMIENTELVAEGVSLIMKIMKIPKAIICVEGNKPAALEKLGKHLSNRDDISVLRLKTIYPQGAEKTIVQAATGRKIAPGKLPADVGCVVMNVASVAFIANYVKTGMPLVSKRITVDGSAVTTPKNLIVPIGISIAEVIELCGGYKETPKKIIMGGPMMGVAVYSDKIPVLKQNNAILAFNEAEAKAQEDSPCIRCGRCVSVCPMSLMPTKLMQCSADKDIEGLKKYGVMSCMECGSCSYICPAKRNIVQQIRLGKTMVRNS